MKGKIIAVLMAAFLLPTSAGMAQIPVATPCGYTVGAVAIGSGVGIAIVAVKVNRASLTLLSVSSVVI
jgi:hypothetical protein